MDVYAEIICGVNFGFEYTKMHDVNYICIDLFIVRILFEW